MQREKTPINKIVVIKNGVDIYSFDKAKCYDVDKKQFGLPLNKMIVTTVANYRYQKGYPFYIDVIDKFKEKFKNAHFVWVGKGPMGDELQEKINKKGLSELITIYGICNDVRSLLACSDIFTLASVEEGMPIALMEAMSMSIPCSTTKAGGIGELIDNGINGLITEYGDIDSFGNNILRLLNDEKLRQSIGSKAREKMAKQFDIKNVAKKYVKLFELVKEGQRDGEEIQKQLNVF